MDHLVEKALPGLEYDVIKKVSERLSDIGVIHQDDLQFVEEENIKDLLKPIQVKKLLKFFNELVKKSAVPSLQQEQISEENIIMANPTTSQNECSGMQEILTPGVNWAENFEIPWSSFPKEVLLACTEKTPVQKKHRSEMVRIIANSILRIDQSPGRRHYCPIAQKIVSKYPDTFQDRYGDTVIAGGYMTMMKKIEDTIDNRKRRSCLQDKFISTTSSNEEPFKRKRKTLRDSYGTVNWQPVNLPGEETKESQKERKDFLISEFSKEMRDVEKVKDHMLMTFASQRFFINKGKISIIDIKREWPFLLEESYMLQHYQNLMKQDIREIFSEGIKVKGKKIYDFMKTKSSTPSIAKVLTEIEFSKELLQNLTPETTGSFLLLMAYFKEERENLFQTFKVSSVFFI